MPKSTLTSAFIDINHQSIFAGTGVLSEAEYAFQVIDRLLDRQDEVLTVAHRSTDRDPLNSSSRWTPIPKRKACWVVKQDLTCGVTAGVAPRFCSVANGCKRQNMQTGRFLQTTILSVLPGPKVTMFCGDVVSSVRGAHK